MIGSALSTGGWSGWIRCSWSAFTSSAAVGAITSSPRSRWVAGRVSPAEVAARDQDRSMPRSAVPVDPRPHAPAARERDGGRPALEIVPLLVVDHREKFGMLDPVELTAHAPPPLDQARILAEAEQPPGDTRFPDEPGAPREHTVQRVATHERPVREHQRRRPERAYFVLASCCRAASVRVVSIATPPASTKRMRPARSTMNVTRRERFHVSAH